MNPSRDEVIRIILCASILWWHTHIKFQVILQRAKLVSVTICSFPFFQCSMQKVSFCQNLAAPCLINILPTVVLFSNCSWKFTICIFNQWTTLDHDTSYVLCPFGMNLYTIIVCRMSKKSQYLNQALDSLTTAFLSLIQDSLLLKYATQMSWTFSYLELEVLNINLNNIAAKIVWHKNTAELKSEGKKTKNL